MTVELSLLPPDPDTPPPSENRALLEQARAGCPEALGQLLDHFRPYLLAVAQGELDSQLRVKEAPSDVVQQTLLDAHRGFPGFRGASGTDLLAWLRAILQCNVRDVWRRFRGTERRQLDRECPLPDEAAGCIPNPGLLADSPFPDDRIAHREQLHLLQQAVQTLPEHYRRVLVLRNQQLMAFPDIARSTGQSEEAVRKLWYRAIDALARKMQLYHDADRPPAG